MAKAKEMNLTATEKFAGKVENWLSKNLKTIVIACAAIVLVVIIASVVTVVSSSSSNKRYEAFAAVLEKIDTLGTMDIATNAYTDFQNEIAADAKVIAAKGAKDYPGAKSSLIIADFAFDNGNYDEAIQYYDAVIKAQSKSYLGQVALMSKAAAVEEKGDLSGAADLYNKIFDDYGVAGIFASRALFNAARCYEKLGQKALAIATYEQCVGEFRDYNSEFAMLAESRISQLN